jgi:hypothetical protein
LYLGAAAVLFLIVSLLVHTTLKDNVAGVADVRPSDFLKILVRHIQFVAIVSTLGAQWPQSLAAIFTGVGWIFASGSPEVVSLDCLFAPNSTSGVPMAIKRTIVYLLAPAAILVLVLLARGLVWLLVRLLVAFKTRGRGFVLRPAFVTVLSVSTLVVVFFFYPSLVRLSLGFFACIPLDNLADTPYPQYAVATADHGYLVADMKQPCWEGWPRAWALALGLPLAIMFCLGVPAAIAVLLAANRKKLFVPGPLRDCLAFLFHDYRQERFYWEVVRTMQIAALVAISVFRFTLGSYFSMLLLQISFGVILLSEHIFKPYNSNELNHAVRVSLLTLILTTTIQLTFFSTEPPAPEVYMEVVGVVGLLANLGFLIWVLVLVAKHSSGVVGRWAAAISNCFSPRSAEQTRGGGGGDSSRVKRVAGSKGSGGARKRWLALRKAGVEAADAAGEKEPVVRQEAAEV